MAARAGLLVREIRIHLCQKSEHSRGVRDFLDRFYIMVKNSNPDLPILIRECQGAAPRIWARYDKGIEKSAPLVNLSADEVSNTLKRLIK